MQRRRRGHLSIAGSSARALARPLREHTQLFIGGEASVRRTLVVRVALVLSLLLAVVLLFWLDRDGLRDNLDGAVSFVDVVYFSMVTVTTVGYGDIVPVTPRARLIDAALVTPIRLFIWLIFLGTAYQLVIQRLIEDIRMRRLQSTLQDHVVICGFGHGGRSAARELVSRGLAPGSVLVIDPARPALEAAAEAGLIGLLGDATQEQTLRQAMVETARAVFVCTGRDDTTVLIVLTVRHLYPTVRIVAMVQEEENDKIIRHSGADVTVLPSHLGGVLAADSLESANLAGYVMDLISAGGRVTLVEREARPEDVGRALREVADGLVLRVNRGAEVVGFWEQDVRIRAGDRLVLIVHGEGRGGVASGN
jgi:voltage-gated potassium channel